MIEVLFVVAVLGWAWLLFKVMRMRKPATSFSANSIYIGGNNSGTIINGLSLGAKGSGVLVTEQRAISGDFDSLLVTGPISVEYTQSEIAFASVTAEDNIVAKVRVVQVGRRLEVSVAGNIVTTHELKVEIRGPQLHEATLDGAGDMTIALAHSPSFAFILEGCGYARLSGKADVLALTISGAGDIDASNLQAREVTAVLAGAGDIRAHASEAVDLQLEGAGDITIYGSPSRVKQQSRGAGDISIL